MYINNIWFEESNKYSKVHADNKNLFDCYRRPSYTKNEIYNYWKYIARKLNASNYGVRTFNSNVFTVEFDFMHEGKHYNAHITPSYNYVSEVKE